MLKPARQLEVEAVPLRRIEGHFAPGAAAAKRAIDLVVASAAFLPAMVLLAAGVCAILLIDRQWPFYRDLRIGRGGASFYCWKLRTMRGDPGLLERRFAEDPAAREAYELTRKIDRDPRRTRLGCLLRKTSIDELPQIFHVLSGRMSVVGPRPLSPAEFEQRGRYRFLLASVRPGLTGLWQVGGRSNLDPAARLIADNYYVRNWSLALDLRILARTPIAVLTARGAK